MQSGRAVMSNMLVFGEHNEWLRVLAIHYAHQIDNPLTLAVLTGQFALTTQAEAVVFSQFFGR